MKKWKKPIVVSKLNILFKLYLIIKYFFRSPLIIFMDVEMPDKNGLLVTSELLNETYYSNIM